MKKKTIAVLAVLLILVWAAAGIWFKMFRKIDISTCSVTVFKEPVYTGTQAVPGISVKYKDHILKHRTDYKIKADETVNAGKASVTLQGIGRYEGETSVSYQIMPARLQSALTPNAQIYNGNPQTPALAVFSGGRRLSADHDYDISYRDNIDVGTASYSVTGKGNYSGSLQGSFSIIPAGTTLTDISEDVSSFRVSWKKQDVQISGYQLQYTTDKTFKSGCRIVTVPGVTALTVSLNKIDPDKAHYVRIRTYREVDGSPYSSGWSSFLKADGFEPLSANTMGAVTAKHTDVYEDNDTQSSVIDTIPFAFHVNTERRKNGWCYVSYSSDGKDRRGYIQESQLVLYDKSKKHIALTFDDGPHPTRTAAILDLLAEYGVRATFFVIGENAEAHPELVERELAEGHEVANHTMTHAALSRLSYRDAMTEVMDAEHAIFPDGSGRSTLLRPPCGAVGQQTLKAAERLGLSIVLWSVDTRDWEHKSAEAIARTVREGVTGGDIILFHDFVSGESHTLEALETLIPELIGEGYEFVTVSELFGPG